MDVKGIFTFAPGVGDPDNRLIRQVETVVTEVAPKSGSKKKLVRGGETKLGFFLGGYLDFNSVFFPSKFGIVHFLFSRSCDVRNVHDPDSSHCAWSWLLHVSVN